MHVFVRIEFGTKSMGLLIAIWASMVVLHATKVVVFHLCCMLGGSV